jgi:anaerobic selenocysteine-containing dehydrogenase
MQTHKTFCRNCTGVCGLEVSVDEARITAVRADRDHPITRGYHCIKASLSTDLANGVEPRLLNSLQRRDDGTFKPIDAEAALDDFAGRLRALIDRYGPRSVALFYGTGAYSNSLATPLAKSFMQALGSPNWFSTMTIDQSALWVTMLRMGYMASGKPLPAEVDTLLLVGNNPLVSHQISGHNPSKLLREMSARGARVIVVDPRMSETARSADMHLQIVPGEDVTLLAGIIRLIFLHDWHDKAFCARFADGLDVLRAAVDSYTPEQVERRCGISPEQLLAATQAFACVSRSLAVGATGLCMGPHSNLAHHLLEALNVLCGNYRRAGERVPNPGVLFPRPFVEGVVPAFRSWEQEPRCRSVNVGQIFGEFPTAALPDEILLPGEDRIRALIVWAGNPLKAIGQPEKTVRAFRKLELLVTIDPRMNETAQLSHYVIAPALQFERHDVSALMDGFGAYSQPFAQYATPIVTAPTGVVQEIDFFWGLARRLGLQLTFKKLIAGMSFDAMPGGHALDMTQKPDPHELVRWWCEGTAVDLETLAAKPGGVVPDVPDTRVQSVPDNGARLQLGPADVIEELQRVMAEKASTKFPYRLATRRLLETLNSAYQQAERTRARYPTNRAYMNPHDLTREGWQNGDAIEIASPHGAIIGIVQADPSVRVGVVSMAHLWGALEGEHDASGSAGAFTGRLVSLDRDVETINRMPRQTGIPVRLRLVSQP